MTQSLKFELITPERLVFSEDVYEVVLPTLDGQIAVFPNHLPLITLLMTGIISLRREARDNNSKLEHVAVVGGYAEITANSVKVLANNADKADEVSELKVQAARQRAKELKEKAVDDISLAQATAELDRSIALFHLNELKKRR